MSSRQEQKAQLRAEREAAERRQAQSDRRKRRVWQLGAAAGLAAVVVVIAIVISGGSGSSSGGLRSGTSGTKLGSTVAKDLAGIPQAGNRLGAASAPVTMTYYGDLECPICRDFSLGTLKQVIDADVRAARVKVVYRSFKTATRERDTFVSQQTAAAAAGGQNRLWNYVELFYQQQGTEGTNYATAGFLASIAKQIPGLDQGKWQTARTSSALSRGVAADEQAATAAGATGTPTLIFEGPGKASALSGAPSYDEVKQAITAAGT